MNEQQRKIMDYVDSQQIDWSKPVECMAIRGDWWRVIQRCESSTGRLGYVVECPDDGMLYIWDEHEAARRTFRNVRRKVKHRDVLYVNLYSNGHWFRYSSRTDADRSAAPGRVECREIVIEWEADADE